MLFLYSGGLCGFTSGAHFIGRDKVGGSMGLELDAKGTKRTGVVNINFKKGKFGEDDIPLLYLTCTPFVPK